MIPKWVHKYERKPGSGRWIFEPSDEYRAIGEGIKNAVRKVWKAPTYFYHLQPGGHVDALRAHSQNKHFLHFDIEDFFGRINRTRITRCLKGYLSYEVARRIATDSTVRHPIEKGRWVLPYGFVQSPILASLVLDKSSVGRTFRRLHNSDGVTVSVYVDDIIVSSNDVEQLTEACEALTHSAHRAALTFNSSKSQGPAPEITAFNIELAHASLTIVSERLSQFAQALDGPASEQQRNSIVAYVNSVNRKQAAHLAK